MGQLANLVLARKSAMSNSFKSNFEELFQRLVNSGVASPESMASALATITTEPAAAFLTKMHPGKLSKYISSYSSYEIASHAARLGIINQDSPVIISYKDITPFVMQKSMWTLREKRSKGFYSAQLSPRTNQICT